MNKISTTVPMLLVLVFASCSKYQVNMLNSTNSVKNEQTGIFNFENDTVRISYSFYGANAPIGITVYNKLNKPLYVDWNRSAVVVGDKALSYTNKTVDLKGNINARTSTYGITDVRSSDLIFPNDISYTSASINAMATLPQNLSFLPPAAQTERAPLQIAQGMVTLPDSLLNKDTMYYNQKQGGVARINVKTASFTPQNSPLVFKSFLTLYTANDGAAKTMLYQQDFYVSKIINTGHDPKSSVQFNDSRGDYFITSKKTGYGKVMKGVGVVAAVGSLVVAGGALAQNTAQ